MEPRRRSAWLGAASLAALLVLSAGTSEARARPKKGSNLEIKGLVALNEFLLRAALDLPRRVSADPAAVTELESRVRTFLHEAGYELATVRAESQDNNVVLTIDEGKLDKIVVRDRSSFETLRLKLELALPGSVFNRPLLEQQLLALKKKYKLTSARYRLVPVERSPERDEILGPLKDVSGIEAFVPEPGHWELHLFIEKRDWQTGWHLNLRLGPPDGARIDTAYQGGSLLLQDDRWSLGVGLGARIERPGNGPFPSRVLTDARYFTPSLIFPGLRPSISGSFDLRGRRRRDVNLERFFYIEGGGSLGLTVEVDRVLFVGMGAGLQTRHTFGLELEDPLMPFALTRPSAALRTYLLGEIALTFDPSEPRRDHRHTVEGEVAYFLPNPDQDALARMRLRHRIPFFFGFHELRFRTQALLLAGDALFTDEEPLDNSFVRGVFGDRYSVRQALGLATEFRISLARDVYKVSLFSDLALFGHIDRATQASTPALATSSGFGFHALILDAVQLDVYFGIGLDSAANVDLGIALWLVQAF